MILTVSSQKYRVSRSLFSWSGTECSHSERERRYSLVNSQMNTQRFLFSTSFEGGATDLAVISLCTTGCRCIKFALYTLNDMLGKWKLKVTSAKPTYCLHLLANTQRGGQSVSPSQICDFQ